MLMSLSDLKLTQFSHANVSYSLHKLFMGSITIEQMLSPRYRLFIGCGENGDIGTSLKGRTHREYRRKLSSK